MNSDRLIRICTWLSDGSPLPIGQINVCDDGTLSGNIYSEEVVYRIFGGQEGDFVLTPDGYLPEKELVHTVDEAWGGKRERAWQTAAALVGPLVQEHSVRDWEQTSSLDANVYVAIAVEKHVNLIQSVANWLLEDK